MKTLFGKKVGMTRIFDATGNMIPVTVVKADPHSVIQVKTADKDGYVAIRVAFGDIRDKLVNKPLAGQFKKAGLSSHRHIRELKLGVGDEYNVGDTIKVDIFAAGEKIKVSGISKGLGFQGAVRRHNFGGGPKTHGQSDRLRAPGSVGASSYPSRTYPGQRMAGHMGNVKVTVKNLRVVGVEPEHNLLLIRGAVPGKPGGLLKIEKA